MPQLTLSIILPTCNHATSLKRAIAALLRQTGGRMLYSPRLLVLARVQADRCDQGYLRRWHEGHGRFHALLRARENPRPRRAPVRGATRLLGAASRDAGSWLRPAATADWERAFAAELRLRFYKGLIWTRLAH